MSAELWRSIVGWTSVKTRLATILFHYGQVYQPPPRAFCEARGTTGIGKNVPFLPCASIIFSTERRLGTKQQVFSVDDPDYKNVVAWVPSAQTVGVSVLKRRASEEFRAFSPSRAPL